MTTKETGKENARAEQVLAVPSIKFLDRPDLDGLRKKRRRVRRERRTDRSHASRQAPRDMNAREAADTADTIADMLPSNRKWSQSRAVMRRKNPPTQGEIIEILSTTGGGNSGNRERETIFVYQDERVKIKKTSEGPEHGITVTDLLRRRTVLRTRSGRTLEYRPGDWLDHMQRLGVKAEEVENTLVELVHEARRRMVREAAALPVNGRLGKIMKADWLNEESNTARK